MYPQTVNIDPEHQIRVLSFSNAELPHYLFPLSCKLSVLTLSNGQALDQNGMPVEYDALSYAWGSDKKRRRISLNGGAGYVEVTENLWTCLLELRRKRWPRKLWIDQMCINQSNVWERNHQVRLMEKIYPQAWQVIVWLGYDGLEDVELSVAKQGTNILRGMQQPMLEPVERWLGGEMSKPRTAWWERIWIVQEVALAREDPIVMFGPHERSWEWLTGGDENLKDDEVPPHRTLTASARYFRGEDDESGLRKDFVSLMDILRRTQSSNRRDKVYALLSLVDPAIRDLIKPDYGKATFDVFAEATYACIAGTGTFDLLALIEERTIGLASWAYDFTTMNETVQRDACSRPTLYQQHLSKILNRRPYKAKVCVRYDSKQALIVRGLLLGRIQAVESAESNAKPGTDRIAPHLTVAGNIRSCLNLVSDILATTCPYEALLKNYNEAPSPAKNEIFDPVDIPTIFSHWRARISAQQSIELPLSTFDESELEDWSIYLHCPRPFLTDAGFVGFGRATSKPGDEIFLPNGSFAPMVLRSTHDGKGFEFEGFAYVEGIMEGELEEKRLAERLEEVGVVLV